MSGAEGVVDARGLRCPWPVLRLSRAARELGSGRIQLLIDDPDARSEVAQLCAERGWDMRDLPETGSYQVLIP